MNSKRFEDLARRKRALIDRAGHERAQFADAYERLCSSLDIKQALLGIGRTLKAHPLLTAGVSSMLASGIAGKLLRGAGKVAALSRAALPLWSWWKNRKSH